MPNGRSQNDFPIEAILSALFGGAPVARVELKKNNEDLKKASKLSHPPMNDIKVLFSDPATILWVNGKKYVSKAHNEDFDEEKGLLMCLAKAHGITHRDIQRMLTSAQRQVVKVEAEDNT